MIKTAADIVRLGTILSVWAHPDDESYLAAGILAAAVANGQTVICVTATKGELGVRDAARWPVEKLGDIRATELDQALKVLGVSNHQWLDYPDGGCNEVVLAEAVTKLADLIKKYAPDTILTFGPKGLTGHPDHCSVSRWTGEAIKQTTKKPKVFHAVHVPELFASHWQKIDRAMDFFFNIDAPVMVKPDECDICFELSDELCAKKLQALKLMPSQTEELFKTFDNKFLHEALGTEAFIESK